MSSNNFGSLLESVNAIASQAGEIIMEIYGNAFDIETKQDNSPLTEADLAAHNYIVNSLASIADYPILSEESAEIPFTERSKWQTYWLVDPLDGTKEFIKRNGDFTVNIALIYQHKPVLGSVYVPVTKQLYFAAEGDGAYKQSPEDKARKISVKKEFSDNLVVVGSRSHITEELKNFLDKLPPHQLISIGSSLKMCLVAEGLADLYPRIGLTSEWDTAAAQCIVEQARGKVVDLKGNRLLYNIKQSLLNPYFLVFGNNQYDWTKFV